jgi:repressor LexA
LKIGHRYQTIEYISLEQKETEMITQAQEALLSFLIKTTVTTGGVSPSYTEMQDHLGLKSKSGVHRLIGALEDRGFIQRVPRKARCIKILRWPNGTPYQLGETNIDVDKAFGVAVLKFWHLVPDDLKAILRKDTRIPAPGEEDHGKES